MVRCVWVVSGVGMGTVAFRGLVGRRRRVVMLGGGLVWRRPVVSCVGVERWGWVAAAGGVVAFWWWVMVSGGGAGW